MEKTIRCTVCTWRGGWSDATSVPPPRPSQIPPPAEQYQNQLDEKQNLQSQFGTPRPPPCPVCGHHTQVVKLHSIRPAT
jgi:hypothetical protein